MTAKDTIHARIENMKIELLRGARGMTAVYQATISTHVDGRDVTITGNGREVWACADAIIRVLEGNHAAFTAHFYEHGIEVDWVSELNKLNLYCLARSLEEKLAPLDTAPPD